MQRTAEANAALISAQQEARLFGQSQIDTEHLLLGVLDREACVAVEALQSVGALRRGLRSRLQAVAHPGDSSPEDHVSFAPAAQRVLSKLAEYEALALNHTYIGTEHLLLALIREADGVAAHVLGQVGAGDSHEMRGRVIDVLSQWSGGDHPEGKPEPPPPR